MLRGMAVILPNMRVEVRARVHTFVRDAHGTPVAPQVATQSRGVHDASVREQGAQPGAGAPPTWNARLAPQAWPVDAGDELHEQGGGARVWVIFGEPRLHAIPGHDDVDYIAATVTLSPPEVD